MNARERIQVLAAMADVIRLQRERVLRFTKLGRVVNLAEEDFQREGAEIERLMRLTVLYQQALCQPVTEDGDERSVRSLYLRDTVSHEPDGRESV